MPRLKPRPLGDYTHLTNRQDIAREMTKIKLDRAEVMASLYKLDADLKKLHEKWFFAPDAPIHNAADV